MSSHENPRLGVSLSGFSVVRSVCRMRAVCKTLEEGILAHSGLPPHTNHSCGLVCRLRRVWNRHEDPNMEHITLKVIVGPCTAICSRCNVDGENLR